MLKKSPKNNGFVVLFAILMVSVVLTISLSLFNITYKQIILSATSKDSQLAYFAAESGLSCALFWNQYFNANNADSPQVNRPNVSHYPFGSLGVVFGADFEEGVRNNIACAGSAINIGTPPNGREDNYNDSGLGTNGIDETTKFRVTLLDGSCAEVEVVKREDLFPPAKAVVTSRGYNNCAVGVPRKVERTLEGSTD